jgi:uncharacterized protein (DUF488 family)
MRRRRDTTTDVAREGNASDGGVAVRPICTIGHSTRSITDFAALLRHAGVDLLVDVRSIPGSRAAPQFNSEVLPAALATHGFGYRHLPALGGRRHRGKGAPPSENTFWRVLAFRDYADYAETEAFRAGLAELLDLAQVHNCAIMCAEAVWWRCHRRIITDYLVTRGVSVWHIMGPDRPVAGTLTPGAIVRPDGTLHYPAPVKGNETPRML